MTDPSYYQLLSVPRDATPEQIRQAYVRAIKQIHPDLAGTDWRPHARLQDLQHAYRCLLDPDARRAHDAALEESDSAHVARLRRVQRRLKQRSHASAGHRLAGTKNAQARRRINGRLLLMIAGAAVIFVKMHGAI